MEKAPRSLCNIVEDINRTKRDEKLRRDLKEIRDQRVRKLSKQVEQLLSTRGEYSKTSVGTGKGGGVIGYRVEVRTIEITPWVEATVKNEKLKIRAVQDLHGAPEYRIVSGGVLIKAAFDDGNELDFFRISSANVVNWRGEEASMEEIDIASDILSYLKNSLPEVEKSDLPHPALREAAGRFVFDPRS
jgi:hypothetical protein